MDLTETHKIGGDFNCCLNSKLDRKYCGNTRYDKADDGLNDLLHIILELDVEDIWRKRFPDIKQYTFLRNESKSRIDYFLTSKIIDSEVSSPKIQHFIHSDHDLFR
jgi:exonuclease III